jgi:4-hydroxy-tetrahydrodipicolinate synthase
MVMSELRLPPWRGVGVALVTLFDADGVRVDAPATAALAARLVGAGVRGILVAGSTGEADALTDDERVALIAAVRAACPGVPLLAGASGAWAGQAAGRVEAAVAAGADAVLVAPPRRGSDLAGYYKAAADTAGGAVPVLAYHFPPLAGGEVPVPALATLPVAGIKDSSGDPNRLLAILDAWDGWTYVGAAALAGYAGWVGATGAILAIANAAPDDAVAAWDGDAAAQRRLGGLHRAGQGRLDLLKEQVARRFGASPRTRMA